MTNDFEELEAEETRARIVAIVGRPNVGKSALFNRVVRRRMAIVHEESGVTRDRLACEVSFGEERFELMDTGGIGFVDDSAPADVIEEGMKYQVEVAIEDAGAIIFAVDATAGVMPMDVEVARLLHDCGCPVFLAANKCDSSDHDMLSVAFEEFGFPVFAVSALHGRGMSDLLEAALATLPPGVPPEERDVLKVAIVGRPNAGKSSYVNRLIREERLIVSEVPGTTRDSIEVPFQIGKGKGRKDYVFIDTAGVRRAGKVDSVVEKFSVMRTETSIKMSDVVLLVLDATEGPKNRDKKLANLVEKHEKGCIILVNKWDLAEGVTTQRQYGKALVENVPFLRHVPIIFASAMTGYNMRRTLEAIDFVATHVDTTLSTGLLNRTILTVHQRTPPPMVKNHRMRIYYCTQVGTRPVRIRLFVNDPKRCPPAYKSFLINKLRATFGLEGAPIVLQFVRRPKKDFEV